MRQSCPVWDETVRQQPAAGAISKLTVDTGTASKGSIGDVKRPAAIGSVSNSVNQSQSARV